VRSSETVAADEVRVLGSVVSVAGDRSAFIGSLTLVTVLLSGDARRKASRC
jgi:hypothetical protein